MVLINLWKIIKIHRDSVDDHGSGSDLIENNGDAGNFWVVHGTVLDIPRTLQR